MGHTHCPKRKKHNLVKYLNHYHCWKCNLYFSLQLSVIRKPTTSNRINTKASTRQSLPEISHDDFQIDTSNITSSNYESFPTASSSETEEFNNSNNIKRAFDQESEYTMNEEITIGPSTSYSPRQSILIDYALYALVRGAIAVVNGVNDYFSSSNEQYKHKLQDEEKERIEKEKERIEKERIEKEKERIEKEKERIEKERIENAKKQHLIYELMNNQMLEHKKQIIYLYTGYLKLLAGRLSIMHICFHGLAFFLKFSTPWLAVSSLYSVSTCISLYIRSLDTSLSIVDDLAINSEIIETESLDIQEHQPKYLNVIELYKNRAVRLQIASFMKRAYSIEKNSYYGSSFEFSLPMSMVCLGKKLSTKHILIRQCTNFTNYNQIWIGIPGTEIATDWLKNLNITNADLEVGSIFSKTLKITGHAGFISVVKQNYHLIKQKLLENFPNIKNSQIFLIGHSLGAAIAHVLAVILACDLDFGKPTHGRVVLVTMGQPQVWSTFPNDRPSYKEVNTILGENNVLRLIACSDYRRDLVTMTTGVGSGVASILKIPLGIVFGKILPKPFLFKHSGTERFVKVRNHFSLKRNDSWLHGMDEVYAPAITYDSCYDLK